MRKVEFEFKAGEIPTTLDGTPRTPMKVVDAATDKSANRIYINTNGGFMSNGFYSAKLPGFGNQEIRSQNPRAGMGFTAFVLFHELGHLLGIYGKNDDDKGNPGREKKNNEKIKACL